MKNRTKLIYWSKALALSFAITFMFIITVSLLLRFTNLGENKLALLNNIIMVFSIAIPSIYLAIQIEKKGWLNGAILGFTYFLVVILINSIAERALVINLILGAKLLIAGIIGSIGGMIGVNLS